MLKCGALRTTNGSTRLVEVWRAKVPSRWLIAFGSSERGTLMPDPEHKFGRKFSALTLRDQKLLESPYRGESPLDSNSSDKG